MLGIGSKISLIKETRYGLQRKSEPTGFNCHCLFNRTVSIECRKGEVSRKLLSFQNPKMFVCQQKQRNNCQICYKLSPQCKNVRLVSLARDRVGRYELKLEKC